MIRRLGKVVAAGVLLLGLGCGNPKGDVSGKVTYRNTPLKGGTVTLTPEGEGKPYGGTISENGEYLIRNVPVGTYKITIAPSVEPPVMPRIPANLKDRAKPPKDVGAAAPPTVGSRILTAGQASEGMRIPPKYKDPEKSGLSVTVEKGDNKKDIELK